MYQYPYGNAQQLNLDWILSKIQELESGSGGGATLEEVANALISATYAVQNYNRSDIVFYDGKLYRANQNITAEAWDATHWDEILLGDTVANLVRYVGSLNNSQVVNISTVPGTHTSDALNNLATDISNLNGALNNFRPNQLKRKWIFIGDSLGHASGTNQGWIDKLIPMMGLQSGDYYESAVGGYGFVNATGTFLTLLTNLASGITDKTAITDIVVIGGGNDLGFNASAVSAAIETFNTYAKNTFQNATVYIGEINGCTDYTKNAAQYSRVKEGYADCGTAVYLNNLEYVLQNRAYVSGDGIHPTATGYEVITKKIYDALHGGCTVIYRDIARSPTYETGYTGILNNSVFSVVVDNGLTSIVGNTRIGKLASSSDYYFAINGSDFIPIATLNSDLFVPAPNDTNNMLVMPCFAKVMSTINNTSYQLKGYAIIATTSQGKCLLFKPNDVIIGTTGAFNSCDRIEIDAFNFTVPSIMV